MPKGALRKSFQQDNRVKLAAVASFALLVLASVLSIVTFQNYRTYAKASTRTAEVLRHVTSTLNMFLDAQTGERGYVVTRDSVFLDPYNHAVANIDAGIKQLGDMLQDTPETSAAFFRLRELKRQHFEYLANAVESIDAGGKVSHGDMIRGKAIMDETRSVFASIIEKEELRLAQRRAAQNGRALVATIVGVIALLASFAMMAVVVAVLSVNREKANEASNMKSQFLANMSHEIRTPMNGILGMTDILMSTPLNGDQVKYVETIKESGNALLALINNILDISKIESGKFELEKIHFRFAEVAEAVVQLFEYSARHKGVKLVLEPDPRIPTFVVGDPLRLRQILMNLVNNALKFTEEGQVTVRTWLREKHNGRLTVCVEVSDTGPGLDAETRAKLFSSFSQGDASTTRKFGGTGLGLAICRQLVSMMEGRIEVESQVGRGSLFWFEIVLLEGSADEVQGSGEYCTLNAGTMPVRILVAEDYHINQKVISAVLNKLGHTYTIVENGAMALQLLQENPAFDIVLMDCHMPVMDGYEATRRIRQLSDPRTSKIPVIAVTANAIKGDRERCVAAGMDGYVSKPISVEDLNQVIRKHVALHDAKIVGTVEKPKGGLSDAWQKIVDIDPAGSKELLHELLRDFLEQSPSEIEGIKATLKQKDGAAMSAAAHKMKSTSKHLGFMELAQIFQELENQGKANDWNGSQLLLARLVEKYAEARETALSEIDQGKAA